MRLFPYADYGFARDGDAGGVRAEIPFALFLDALRGAGVDVVHAGRLHPDGAAAPFPHRMPEGADVRALPWYPSAAAPLPLLRALGGTARRAGRIMREVDGVLVFGPGPAQLLLVALALAQRRPLAIGVRQDYPSYIATRHPGRRAMRAVAAVFEALWRALGLRVPTVVVGPDLARRYRHAPRLLEIMVSLVDDAAVSRGPARPPRDRAPVALSVGRLDAEKNPLLLADVLAALRADGRDWRLQIAGDGPLRPQLERRLAELGVDRAAELLGYVPIDGGLGEHYAAADVLLHVSWTEGVPQVLVEAFAAGVPVVATDVGGVAQAVGDAALLIPPGDAAAAAAAVRRAVDDADTRRRLVAAGTARAAASTRQAVTAQIAGFLRTSWGIA